MQFRKRKNTDDNLKKKKREKEKKGKKEKKEEKEDISSQWDGWNN